MYETHKRSFLKGISWRVIATTTTMTLVYFFTGNLTITFGVGIFDTIAKLLFYYAHERAWNKVRWGRTDSKGKSLTTA